MVEDLCINEVRINEVTVGRYWRLEMVAPGGDGERESDACISVERGLETGGGSKMGIGHLGPHPRLVANHGIQC